MTAPPQTAEPVVELREVSTTIGDTVIHREISFTIYRGELFAIVGRSGSGKSVLLREMILLREPGAGSIRVLGRDLNEIDPDAALQLRRRCGVLFQEGALFSALTVAENVATPLREHTALSERLIEEIAAVKIGLTGFPPDAIAKYPNELSSGMRRRAALARAIALDPELLFLDEPTAGLDPISSRGLDDLIDHLKGWLGLTVVMVTHDLDTLWRVADRVAMLADGKIIGIGTMTELSRSNDLRIRAFFQGPRGPTAPKSKEKRWNKR